MPKTSRPRKRKLKSQQGKRRSTHARTKNKGPSAASVLELLNFNDVKATQSDTDNEDGFSDAISFDDDKEDEQDDNIDNNILAFLKEQLKAKEAAVTSKMSTLAKRAIASTKSFTAKVELDKHKTIQSALDEIDKIQGNIQTKAAALHARYVQLMEEEEQSQVELSTLTQAYKKREEHLSSAREANMVRLQGLRDQFVTAVAGQAEILHSLAA